MSYTVRELINELLVHDMKAEVRPIHIYGQSHEILSIDGDDEGVSLYLREVVDDTPFDSDAAEQEPGA